MIIEIEKEYQNTVDQIRTLIIEKKCRPDVLLGDLFTVIAVEGDATQLDSDYIETFPGVVRTWRITSPYKTISRRVIGEDNRKVERKRRKIVITGPDQQKRIFSDESFIFIAGPCTVESYDQTLSIAEALSSPN